MPLSNYAEDKALDYLGANDLTYVSLHNAYNASGVGGTELTGGGYSRQVATWSTASGGSKSLASTLPSFSVASASTVAFIGFWDASSSGNFGGMFPNGGAAPYTFAASSSNNVFTAAGSSYSNGQTVVIFATAGSTLPGGFTAGAVYYVVSASTDTFKLSTSSGGTAVTVTADGSGIVAGITQETFGSAGTFALTSGSVSIT